MNLSFHLSLHLRKSLIYIILDLFYGHLLYLVGSCKFLFFQICHQYQLGFVFQLLYQDVYKRQIICKLGFLIDTISAAAVIVSLIIYLTPVYACAFPGGRFTAFSNVSANSLKFKTAIMLPNIIPISIGILNCDITTVSYTHLFYRNDPYKW